MTFRWEVEEVAKRQRIHMTGKFASKGPVDMRTVASRGCGEHWWGSGK